MKQCLEYRVEGRRPVGRPRRTWLESVEGLFHGKLEQGPSRVNNL